MTSAAQQVMKEIQALPLEERREIWRQLGHQVAETPSSCASDAEFEIALEEVTGCTARRNATDRLLDERRREHENLQARAISRSHA